jgi:mono/diheme cytochrome c family protein
MRSTLAFAVLFGLAGCAAQSLDSMSRVTAGEAQRPDVVAQQRGAAYAEANCAGCHAIGATGESPVPAAPHFRDLGLRYPIDDLAEAFAEGINTGHAEMPEFVMSTEENADMIAYLKSIQGSSTP